MILSELHFCCSRSLKRSLRLLSSISCLQSVEGRWCLSVLISFCSCCMVFVASFLAMFAYLCWKRNVSISFWRLVRIIYSDSIDDFIVAKSLSYWEFARSEVTFCYLIWFSYAILRSWIYLFSSDLYSLLFSSIDSFLNRLYSIRSLSISILSLSFYLSTVYLVVLMSFNSSFTLFSCYE
jgi:hypothetical protein